jgi:hypothetical protein
MKAVLPVAQSDSVPRRFYEQLHAVQQRLASLKTMADRLNLRFAESPSKDPP